MRTDLDFVTDEELIDRAMRAYFRRFGKHADQPACYSEVKGTKNPVVELVNCNGVLARYGYCRASDRLTFIEPKD